MDEWVIRINYLRRIKQKIAKRMLKNKKINQKQYQNIQKGLRFKAFTAVSAKLSPKDKKKRLHKANLKKLRELSAAYQQEEKQLNYINGVYIRDYNDLVNAKQHKKDEENPYENATGLTKAQDEQSSLNHDPTPHNIEKNLKHNQDNPFTNTDHISFNDTHNPFKTPDAKRLRIRKIRQENDLER